MICDQPAISILNVGEAIARGKRCYAAVLGKRHRVIASIDGGVAIHADQLIPEADARYGFEDTLKVAADCGWVRSHRWGTRAPQDTISAYSATTLSVLFSPMASIHLVVVALTSSFGPAIVPVVRHTKSRKLPNPSRMVLLPSIFGKAITPLTNDVSSE